MTKIERLNLFSKLLDELDKMGLEPLCMVAIKIDETHRLDAATIPLPNIEGGVMSIDKIENILYQMLQHDTPTHHRIELKMKDEIFVPSQN